WKAKTVNTFLTRLVDKGVLAADRRGRAFVYSASVSRENCIRTESESFLRRVFQGATGDLMVHFLRAGRIDSGGNRAIGTSAQGAEVSKMSVLESAFRLVLDASWRMACLIVLVLA